MQADGDAQVDLDEALAGLRRDWATLLSPRLRTLEHEITTICSDLRLRLHYPTISQARATIDELIKVISTYLAHYCLPRGEVEAVYAECEKLDRFEQHAALTKLNDRARSLFMRATSACNRNGEAGELILYLLTEWVLDAPQILAKMSHKTSRDMPVHGSDGVHVRFDPAEGKLLLYSGEAKLHARVTDAIDDAVASVKIALTYPKLEREMDLVRRDIHLSGLSPQASKALLNYLDPFEEKYHDRIDVVTCLIGFDFSAYGKLAGKDADEKFAALATGRLAALAPTVSQALVDAGLGDRPVEMFFFPVPSVSALRRSFQDRIGWRSDGRTD